MGIRPHALYSTLLQDLSEQMSSRQAFERMVGGENDWPGISYRDKACTSLKSSFLKKLETGMTEETKRVALEKFLASNSLCKEWELPQNRSLLDELMLNEFKQLIWSFWNRPSNQGPAPLIDHFYDLLSRGGVGPGAGLKADGNDFYTKFFSSRLVGTSPKLYFWYNRYVRNFPSWAEAESLRSLEYGEYAITDENRLDFVPKNDSESRSICIEPPLNMFAQLGLKDIMQRRLRELWGVNLEVQQFLNRDLARVGSWDGQYSTIDLSSASDSISAKMLKWALPSDFFRWLWDLRCSKSRLPDGRLVELEMISTMGNGFTFPLQTILFTAAVLACFRVDGLAPIFPTAVSTGSFGVNGDDIIVPTRIYPKVRRLLQLLGFRVNEAKTFAEGPFRESCGGDYFQGRNLRGVYIKRLSKPQDLYAVINQLNLFSARTGVRLSRTVQTLLRSVKFQPVPLWANEDSGIRIPSSLLGPRDRVLDHNGSFCFYSWEPVHPPRIRIMENSLAVPKAYKRRAFNPPGLYLSFLQQSVNACSITLRPRVVHYKWKLRIAPNWDISSTYVGGLSYMSGSALTVHSFREWLSGPRFESAVFLNLFG